ncbi:hypothetical protein CSW08_16440 [Confluentibacter flavum]|uniref:Uncharacterized protein n=2 Tax=Confluentibacter flavum TaxID=1909700 RepID=A0A2N3HF50_9FLAO|nr:hypothetical protein CSW08_16440 [Confluentibacter flavum]
MACQPKVDNTADELFNKNSETVLANIKGFEDENQDYSMYADNAILLDTGVGAKDSLSLDDVKKNDKMLWETYDFKLITDPLVLLPGVNPDTKKPDGSVRYYGEWEVTLPATDSTEAKSAVMKYYESLDFNEEGKIILQQGYGDFGGLFTALHSDDADKSSMMEE